MKRVLFASCLLVLVSFAAACTQPTPGPAVQGIRPGETIAGMTLTTSPDESHAKADIWSACSPYITASDPAVIQKECSLPQLPYLFIGLGDIAEDKEELMAVWEKETWEMYFDDQKIDLPAFGTIESHLADTFFLISWNVLLENPKPGLHKLRYVIHNFEGSSDSKDVTWMLTIGEPGSSSAPLTADKTQIDPLIPSALQPGQHAYSSSAAQLNLLLYLPDGYEKDAQIKWPLILFLHGSGEAGSDPNAHRTKPLPVNLESQPDFPFVVVSPLLSGETGKEFWPQEAVVDSLFTLLEEIQSILAIDPARIYLTGVSLGGNGVWEIGLRYPEYFAALVPVMGYYGYPFTVPDNICDLKDVPIWAFHGAQDIIVALDAQEGLVDALKACEGNIRFTVYPGAGHDIDAQVYATQELYDWLLEQKLK